METSWDPGQWAFRNRSWLPIPLAIAVVILSRHAHPTFPLVTGGLALQAFGESLRLWAVRHIGAISRTRANRLGPLVTSGPYAFVRHPLYVGNWCLWTGLVLSSGVLWMLAVAWLMFGVQYALITAYEERLLKERRADYDDYKQRVPSWIPGGRVLTSPTNAEAALVPWRAVLFSERSTLTALVVMNALLFWRWS
jgi:protein-S-isoprenylcysteine O-methyltransferase Ste14